MLQSQEPQIINETPPSNSHDTETGSKAQDSTDNTGLETVHHLSGSRLYFVLGGLGLAIYLFALDFSVISTAIPYITVEFSTTTDIGWYGAAYPLCVCSLQPLSGKLYTHFSLKWTLFGFISVFLLGSLLCGVATTSNIFILGRAVAGAGGAGIFSGSLSILAIVAPLPKRPFYLAGLSSLFGLATITGPIIGGALTTSVTWRWCFYINLPVEAVTLVALALFFKPPERDSDKLPLRERLLKIDIIGCALFIPTIVMVLLALQWGGHAYEWKSATVVGLFCGSAGLATAFLRWEYYQGDNAMIPFSVVLQRSILLSSIFSFLMFGCYIVNVYYIPEWFQVVKGANPLHSGIMTLPMVCSQIVASMISSIIINRTGFYNPWFFIGIALMTIVGGLYTSLTISAPRAKWVTYLVLQGIGSVAMQPALLAVQAILASNPQQIPIGISTIAFFQYFGASVFQSIALAIFQTQLIKSLKQHADLQDDQVQTLLSAGTAHARETTRSLFPTKIDSVVWAYNKAITSVFYASVGAGILAFILACGIEWKDLRAKPPFLEGTQNASESPPSEYNSDGTVERPTVTGDNSVSN